MTQLALPGVFLPTPSPAIKDPEVSKTFRQLQAALEQELAKSQRPDRAITRFLMTSPGDKVYEITISDAGAFVATKVFG